MDLVETPFACRDIQLRLLAAPGAEPVVDERTDPDRIPFWSVLWPAVAPFTAWLLECSDWSECPVLELGCGVGLTGLALSAAGAEVTQSDLFPEAVHLARRNAARNGLRGVRQIAADWRHWPLRRRWPVIVGSDLTYERACHAPLLAVLEQALAPGGTVHLADPGRPMTLDFLARAEQGGWHVELEPLPARSGAAAGYRYQLRLRGRGVME